MELAFIEEEIPKITRAGGSGREAEPWEDHIAPLKQGDKAGKSFRVWTYSKRASGVSRMSSVRERLTKAVPGENWQLAVRPVPGTEGTDAEGNDTTQYGVYVQYAGTFTPEQILENAKKHQERSERVRNARAATAAAQTAAPAEPADDGQSPAERVAAARQTAKQAAVAS